MTAQEQLGLGERLLEIANRSRIVSLPPDAEDGLRAAAAAISTAEAQLKAARESLEKLACRHVTEQPLWWQIEARTALLNTKDIATNPKT